MVPSFLLCMISLMLVLVSPSTCGAHHHHGGSSIFPFNPVLNRSVSALLVFGDSTVDPGNNNFVKTAFRSNFPPYGRDYYNQLPTGRFTDGRLVTDYTASHLGIKETIPPYLDPTLTLEEMLSGVSFASAGSGYDPLTSALTSTISISSQIQNFREYKKKVEHAIGKEKMENLVKGALFAISAGTNDFINYYLTHTRSKEYSVSSYQHFIVEEVSKLIQELWEEGARRFVQAGLPPLGCLPAVITVKSATPLRRCLEVYEHVAKDYNAMLQTKLKSLQNSLPNHEARIEYLDVYSSLSDVVRNPNKYGFDVVTRGCCGTGLLEASFLCNPTSYVCLDASKYAFFDSIHPTDAAYYVVFQAITPAIDSIAKK